MRIGINIASYLPHAIHFPGKAVEAAANAGYDFLQVLPLRGLARAENLRALSLLPVEYVEEAWGTASSLMRVLWDKASGNAGAPTLLDYVAFPTGKRSDALYQQIVASAPPSGRPLVIEHCFGKGDLTEIHPGLWLSPEQIVEKAAAQKVRRPLVPDLWHLRHEATPEWIARRPSYTQSKTLLGRWQDSLPLFLPYSHAIHVSPSRVQDELGACLRGKPTELEDMIACVRDSGWDGDLIVEATIGARGLNFGKLSRVLRDFRSWLEEQE